MFTGRQQEGAELALFPIHRGEEVLLQQPGEELLRQVLGLVGRMALAADESVKWIPIGAAQAGKGLFRLRRAPILGGDDEAPMGGREPAGGSWERFWLWVKERHGRILMRSGVKSSSKV